MSDGHGATPDPPRSYGAAPWERHPEPAGSHPDIEVASNASNAPWAPPKEWIPKDDRVPTTHAPRSAKPKAPAPRESRLQASGPKAPGSKAPGPKAPARRKPVTAPEPAATREEHKDEDSGQLSVAALLAREGADTRCRSHRRAKDEPPAPPEAATPPESPSVAALLAREGADPGCRSHRRAKDEPPAAPEAATPPPPPKPPAARKRPAPPKTPLARNRPAEPNTSVPAKRLAAPNTSAPKRSPSRTSAPPNHLAAPVSGGSDAPPHGELSAAEQARMWADESHTDVLPCIRPMLPDLDVHEGLDTHTDLDTRAVPTLVGDRDAAVRNLDDRRKRSRRSVYAGRGAAALIAVLSLSLTGGAWQWSNVKNNHFNHIDALDPNSHDIRDPNGQYGDENFLIIGVDTRAGANSEMGAGDTSDAEGTRSDTVMLVNIPANRKRVAVVSFPRDLAIEPTLCDTWNEDSRTYGPEKAYTETKLNSAFAYGGPKCLVKVIQKVSGLNINRFLAVDFAGFAKMVDALGGVEVCSTTPLRDYELGTVLENAGRQTIDGRTALQYVRARQVTTEINGDYGRIKRQQLFLSSLLRSMISQNTFFSLNKLNSVVNTFIEDSYVDNIKTKDLVELGQSLQDVKAGRITFLTVPTDGTDSEGNETPRTGDIRKIFDAIINDDPLPGELQADGTRVPMPGSGSEETTLASSSDGASALAETSTATPTPAAATTPVEPVELVTTEPGEVNVHVSNSTGQSGLASATASKLSQYGFGITTKDDYPVQLSTTTVFFAPGHEQQAATVAATLGGAKLQRVTGSHASSVRAVLGADFSSTSPPPAAGSPVQLPLTSGTMAPTELPVDLTVVNAADTTCE